MRVAWVHPSWRDLVIDHLGSDPEARERFLRGCSVHGALLAVSRAGGRAGDREFPLLKADADWDALGDRIFTLVPELEPAELVGLMDALVVAIRAVNRGSNHSEADALALATLTRCRNLWNAHRGPIPVPLLEAWLRLAAQLTPPPEPPAIGATWAELLPAGAPVRYDRVNLERFADWLTVAELLWEHAPELLVGLGFSGYARRFSERLLDALEHPVSDLRPAEVDPTLRAIGLIPRLIPSLSGRAARLRFQLMRLENLTSPSISTTAPETSDRTGRLDVRRVLDDL